MNVKRPLALLLACALGASLSAGCSAGEDPASSFPSDCSAPLPPSAPWPYAETLSIQPKGSEAVDAALARFGLELLKQARAAGREKAAADSPDRASSTLVSPLSVSLALSMAANGADRETLAQFREVLGGGADLDELNAACAQSMFDYQGLPGSTKFSIANSLWKDHQGGIYEGFVSKCRGYYSAQVYDAELSDPRIVDDLNQWVSDKTNGRIPKIVDEPFGEDTACLLVNALYLKNTWKYQFDPLNTRERDFIQADGQSRQMDFLNNGMLQLPYLHSADGEGVILPYDDGRLAFFALMPDRPSELESWLSALDGDALSRSLTEAEDALFLHLALPKFEAEWSGRLEDILADMGLSAAFDPDTADFSRLGDSEYGYYISQVIHAAKIEVNEKGTEAAAATVVEAAAGAAMPPEGVTLVFDRPFLYGIVDLQTGVPLFLGTFE